MRRGLSNTNALSGLVLKGSTGGGPIDVIAEWFLSVLIFHPYLDPTTSWGHCLCGILSFA